MEKHAGLFDYSPILVKQQINARYFFTASILQKCHNKSIIEDYIANRIVTSITAWREYAEKNTGYRHYSTQ